MNMLKVVMSVLVVAAVTILGGCREGALSPSPGSDERDTLDGLRIHERYRSRLSFKQPAPPGTIEYWVRDTHFSPRRGTAVREMGRLFVIHDGRGKYGYPDIRIEMSDLAIGTTTRTFAYIDEESVLGTRLIKTERGVVTITEIDELHQTVSGYFAFVMTTPSYYSDVFNPERMDTVYGTFTKLSATPPRMLQPQMNAVRHSATTGKRLFLEQYAISEVYSVSGKGIAWSSSSVGSRSTDGMLHFITLAINADSPQVGVYSPTRKVYYETVNGWFEWPRYEFFPVIDDPTCRIVITRIDSTNWCFEGTFDLQFSSTDTTERYRIIGTFQDIEIP